MCKCVAIGTAASITPQWHHSAKAKTKSNNNNNKKNPLKNKNKNKQTKNPKRQQRESPTHMRSLAQDCRLRMATEQRRRYLGLILTSHYGTMGLRVQPVRVCAGLGRRGGMERSRGYRMHPGSLRHLAEWGTSKKSATPVPWWQCDVFECVHALSSSCIVASGLGWGGGGLPPTVSLKTINQ